METHENITMQIKSDDNRQIVDEQNKPKSAEPTSAEPISSSELTATSTWDISPSLLVIKYTF